MLAAIWTTSIALMIASLAIMCVLIAMRVFASMREERQSVKARELRMAFARFGVEQDREGLQDTIAKSPADLVAEIGFEYLRLVRGEERKNLERELALAGVPSHVRRVLRRGNRLQRIEAAERLVSFPSPKNLAFLKATLSDISGEVRIAAAIAINDMGGMTSLGSMLDAIGDKGCRSSRTRELFFRLPPDRADELREIAAAPELPTVLRANALAALGGLGDYSQIGFLQERAEDAEPLVAAAAIAALGECGHPASGPVILRGLKHAHPAVRAAAVRAVGKIGLVEVVAEISPLLDDGNWSIRFAAASTLEMLGEQGIAELDRLAHAEGSRRQRAASLTLDHGMVA